MDTTYTYVDLPTYRVYTHYDSLYITVVPNLGGNSPRGGGIWPSLGGGDEQLSKTIQHLFGLKIHLIYNYKASDSLNFHEIKCN